MENEVQFNRELQEQAMVYLKALVAGVRKYMLSAIKYSHQGKVTREEFWRGLFISEGTGWDSVRRCPTNNQPILTWREGTAEECPPDPYAAIDFQACNKYLAYGAKRIVKPGVKPEYARDNYLFFKTFGISCSPANDAHRPGGPESSYYSTVQNCITLRNYISHDEDCEVSKITPRGLSQKVEDLKALTKCLEIKKHKGWEAKMLQSDGTPLKPIKEFWEEQDAEYDRWFGAPPIEVSDIGRERFGTTSLSPEQNNALAEALEFLNIKVIDGLIYRERDRKALLTKLAFTPSVAALLPAQPVVMSKKPEAAKAPAAPLNVLRSPFQRSASTLLQKAGFFMTPSRDVLNALAQGFTLLVDESIFLSSEGRELLEKQLMPSLKDRKGKLFVDESVISTLFRQFRRSVPYTELELSEMEPELREELQDIRRDIHRSCKAAIKVIGAMRSRRCLEVVASLTDSEQSYENIFQVVEENPQSRFFVLSLDNELAEELQTVSGHNAVVAKPTLDQRLLVYKSSWKTYQALLSEQAPKPEAPRQAPAVPERLTLSGSRVTAEWPDGTRQELRLGKSIGSGGEGEIYATSADGSVAKIYYRRQLTQERRDKLSHMVRQNPCIPGLCWPQAMVYSASGEWLGFLMPCARGRELALTVYHPGRNNSTLKDAGWTRKSLALIAANIAAAFAKMHEKGILMGDVNPRNFMVAPDCSVFLVDCDSYQFDGFPCPVGTPLYTSPEIHRQMKAEGRLEYDYTRTSEHEKYALAVLLFEILMLGKAPYESRNTDNEDVIQAIIAGNFPYPYKGDEEEERNNARSTVLAPVGRWRQIWSHLTYRVKTGFYETFTGKGRLTATEWEGLLREYVRQIELGHSSDELVPTGYKDTSDRGGGEMVDLICTQPGCRKHFNLGKEVYQRRKDRGEPDLCPTHRDIRQNLSRRMVKMPCGVCGAKFDLSALEWTERSEAGRPLLCPSCVTERVTCSSCRKTYPEKRDRVQDLKAKGTPLLCPECLPTVACETCGSKFRTPKEKVESLRRSGRQVLCKSCLDKLLAAKKVE